MIANAPANGCSISWTATGWRARLLAEAAQRATGTLHLAVKRRGDATVLDRFRQEGCLKARLPRPERGAWTTAVTLNSSGGVAQGDRLSTAVTAGAGTRLTVASQAAERFYRSPGGDPAQVRTTLTVAPGAALEWLPQEAILFDECALDRRLDIDLAEDAWLLAVETLVFGRALMGETVRQASLRDTIRVRRAGALLLHDAIRLQGPVQDVLDRPAVAAGGRAVATLIHAGPGAAAALDGLRSALAPFEAGASVIQGVLVARMVARDGACARAAIVAGLAALRQGRPLPRVWSC
jgi:urease accessory protein